jgi:hypothetical protein
MGVNTDAILFYGFHAGENEWDELIGEGDWQDVLATASGHPPPSAPFSDDTQDEHLAFWRMKKSIADAEPCDIDFHCSGSAPMPFVCVKASRTTSARGDANEIKSLAVDPTWDEALQIFTKKMGIPWQQPRWWLVSYWSH